MAEMVEVLPEGGEGGYWRLERRVYRDVEVPWYICCEVMVDAVSPMECKIVYTYRREVDGKLEAHVELSLYDGEGALCPLASYNMPTPLFVLSSYLRDGTAVVNVKWGEVKRVDAREWEEGYRDPHVKGLAASLRDSIAGIGPRSAPPVPGVWVKFWTWPDRAVDVELWHDLMRLDLQNVGW